MLKSEFLGKSGYGTQDFLGGSLSLLTADTRQGLDATAKQTVAAMKEHITNPSKLADFNHYVGRLEKAGDTKQAPAARTTAKLGTGM